MHMYNCKRLRHFIHQQTAQIQYRLFDLNNDDNYNIGSNWKIHHSLNNYYKKFKCT